MTVRCAGVVVGGAVAGGAVDCLVFGVVRGTGVAVVGGVVAERGGAAPLAGVRAAARDSANGFPCVAGDVLNVASTPRPATVARMTGVMRRTMLRSELEAFEVDLTTRHTEQLEPAADDVDERRWSADVAVA